MMPDGPMILRPMAPFTKGNTLSEQIAALRQRIDTLEASVQQMQSIQPGQGASINALTSAYQAVTATQDAQAAAILALQEQLALRKVYADLGTVTVGESNLLSVWLGGEKTITKSVPGVLTTDMLVIQPQATFPAGYGLKAPVTIPGNGQLRFVLSVPALSIGASWSLAFKVGAFR